MKIILIIIIDVIFHIFHAHTPIVASAKARASQNVNARRCVTPEPQGSHVKERKQLILDLR